MSTQVTIELPEGAFSALKRTPEEFVREMRLAAAVKWYEIGLISQSKAAELAGVSRTEFISSLSRFNVSPFQETPEELEKEFERDQEMGAKFLTDYHACENLPDPSFREA